MNRLIHVSACATLALAFSAFAEEEAKDGAETVEAAETAEGEKDAQKSAASESFFRTLPLCRHLEGRAEVLLPAQTGWCALEEGRFYPLGSTYRTLDPSSKLVIEFGKECQAVIEGVASFATRRQALGEKSRSISLVSGRFALNLPRNLPPNSFSVAAPGFTVTSASGNSTFAYEKTGDGDEAVVRCVTGALAVKGLHFEIPAMHAADEFRLRTSQDLLFTGIYGTSGDYELRLDQGMIQVRDIEKGTTHIEPKTLIWKLSPRTYVSIHRARPKVGARLSVTTMTFEPSGKLVNRCAFSEGRYELNTGEQGELALKQLEEQSKKAAESAETAAAAQSAEEKPAEAKEEGASEGSDE